MAQRVFIKVVGFSEEERHALNTVFKLSEQCRTMYQLWTPEAPEAPRVALLDANSHEARLEGESPFHQEVPKLWVGPYPPATAWRSFDRPLAWGEVVESLDALFAAGDGLDLDLDLGGAPDSVMSQKQALIVSADRDCRLYLRARLALAKLTLADEAETGAEAVTLMRDKQYDVALVDGRLADMDAWALLRQLRTGRHAVAHVAITKQHLSAAERFRAWLAGVEALRAHPPRLQAWLSRI
jgi:CheY-like chemotaxis protein